MRFFFLTKKQKKKAIAYLVGIARVIHRNNVQLFQQDYESYEFCLEALCELSYLVGGIPGMNAVRYLDWKKVLTMPKEYIDWKNI